jgi:uncharacterized protein (TIGR03083 family)
MSFSRAEVLSGITREFAEFEELIRSIDAAAWDAASRCEGWTVADVCRHVTGSTAAIATGQFEDLVGPDATARQVAQRQDRSRDALADEFHEVAKVTADLMVAVDDSGWVGPPPLDIPGTMGDAVETIWYDTYLHGDDVRSSLGLTSLRGGGLQASINHIALTLGSRGWGPATLTLDGMPDVEIGGGGRVVAGDPLTFVLVATGRAPASKIGLDPSVNIYAV